MVLLIARLNYLLCMGVGLFILIQESSIAFTVLPLLALLTWYMKRMIKELKRYEKEEKQEEKPILPQ